MSDAPVMKILYGPPGTGKTYRAAREAVRAVTGTEPRSDASARSQFKTLVAQERIWWVTFHPSYTYEDFVEGFRPKLTSNGDLVYEVEPGPFRLACGGGEGGGARLRHDIAAGEKLVSTGKSTFDVVRADENSVTVRSQVSRKDKVASSKEEVVTVDLLEKLKKANARPDELSFSGKDHAKRKALAKRAGVPVTTFTVTGPIRAVYARYLTWTPPKTKPASASGPVAIVIDEINRADLSRVFGELITLLEPDKRAGAAEERRVFLPYSKALFTVPADLSVIGTMNTADRSLALMDFALRRRFEFVEVAPSPGLCPKAYGGVDVAAMLETWNDRITVLRSRDHRIGHAELMEPKLESVRTAAGWKKTNDGELRALAYTVRTKVIPTLLEYFHEDWRRCRAVLGLTDANLMVDRAPADGAEYYGELAEVSESGGFDLTEWWDPASKNDKWDPDTLRAVLNRLPGAPGK